MITHAGKRTLTLENRPYLLSHAAAVGKKEGEGPLGSRFDFVTRNDRMGQKSWELAESELQRTAIDLALRKGSLRHCDLDLILAGDLLNQCIGSFLASMHSDVPYLGQYGACSTMAQGLALGGVLVEAGAAARLAVSASSHFCSAERQYRFPLAYGGQRTPTAQWTATAAGAAVLGAEGGSSVRMTHVLFGKMIELGVKDANNMGAAMAPEDVNLDPYIFRRAERCVLQKIRYYHNHTLVFPLERTETENRQSPLMPDWRQGGLYLRKCFSYPNTGGETCRFPCSLLFRLSCCLIGPDFFCNLFNERQLAPLVLIGDKIAFLGGSEAALRAERQLLERHIFGSLTDTRDNVFLLFQSGILGGYQTQNDLLLADVAQRLETAGTVAVVLEEEAVHVAVAEQDLRYRLIAAGGRPGRAEVAATDVHGDNHVLRLCFEDLVEHINVLAADLIYVDAALCICLALLSRTELAPGGIIKL